MAKGAIAKKEIIDKLLETFEGSFLMPDGKELRIPFNEQGSDIQIKISLTCAKENVDNSAGKAEPKVTTEQASPQKIEVTEEEKKNIQNLMESLNL